jgi:hypothetical protein
MVICFHKRDGVSVVSVIGASLAFLFCNENPGGTTDVADAPVPSTLDDERAAGPLS